MKPRTLCTLLLASNALAQQESLPTPDAYDIDGTEIYYSLPFPPIRPGTPGGPTIFPIPAQVRFHTQFHIPPVISPVKMERQRSQTYTVVPGVADPNLSLTIILDLGTNVNLTDLYSLAGTKAGTNLNFKLADRRIDEAQINWHQTNNAQGSIVSIPNNGTNPLTATYGNFIGCVDYALGAFLRNNTIGGSISPEATNNPIFSFRDGITNITFTYQPGSQSYLPPPEKIRVTQ